MKPSQSESQDEVQGPAVVTRLHVQARPATDRDMKPITGKTAWTKWTPLESAYQNGKLQGGSAKYSPVDRFNAGKKYEEIWDTAQCAGRDSTQALNISRGTGGGSISQSQSDAIKALVAVECHLSQRDRSIIRNVCGMGMFPSEAVARVSADYTKATAARFREALDALVEAWETVRREPGAVRL